MSKSKLKLTKEELASCWFAAAHAMSFWQVYEKTKGKTKFSKDSVKRYTALAIKLDGMLDGAKS